ncbi:ABC1 family protein [Smittium culicis]|uniref:ABC1 family protein n=1 Tax=Smittium culicis TaxID=133412 RepID=A0A1R1X9L6_9FUNG|nr:ABC1 family protein [Smittium culicis]
MAQMSCSYQKGVLISVASKRFELASIKLTCVKDRYSLNYKAPSVSSNIYQRFSSDSKLPRWNETESRTKFSKSNKSNKIIIASILTTMVFGYFSEKNLIENKIKYISESKIFISTFDTLCSTFLHFNGVVLCESSLNNLDKNSVVQILDSTETILKNDLSDIEKSDDLHDNSSLPTKKSHLTAFMEYFYFEIPSLTNFNLLIKSCFNNTGIFLLQVKSKSYSYYDQYVREPIMTFVRFGRLVGYFAPIIITLPLIFFGTRVQTKDNELSGAIWWYKLVCRQMSLAGPTFVKLSQWASTRTDIFPPQFCIEISKLQSDNKPHSFSFTRSVLESNLPGGNINQIFEWIDPVPMGVGSIAQVHRAKLNKNTIDLVIAYAENIIHQNGIEKIPAVSEFASIKHKYPQINSTQNKAVNKILLENISLVNFLRSEKNEVAVKILHPRVDKLINRDLRIMSFFAHLISLLPTLKWLSLPEEVATFGEMMRTQLDLRIEGQNFLQFSNNFNFRENGKNILRGSEISFPIPILLLSSKKFLIEKFCDGVSIDLFLKNTPSSFDKEISRLGKSTYLDYLTN